MSEFRDTGVNGEEQRDGQVARRLAELSPLPAAPPAPREVMGLVRRRRRQRRGVQAGASALAVALLAVAAAYFAPASAPAPGPEEATVRWAHLTDPDLPTAVRLHHAWLRTGELPRTSGEGGARPAARAPLRPLDALNAAALDPLG